ncbi:MAG: MbnP family copper-binding protein [Polyangia bacterium]
MKRVVVAALGLCACGPGGHAVSIPFSASVVGAPFSCTSTYASIGTSGTTIAPLDLRFFVSDVQLITNGVATPLTLDENEHQSRTLALVDLEDGTGTCDTQSPETWRMVTGRAASADFDTVQLTLGVPLDEDRLDVVAATPPLDTPAMFFGALAGYKYVNVDVRSDKTPSWIFNLGAQTCSAASDSSLVCKYPNLAVLSFPWHAGATIDLDLATLFATSDLDSQPSVADPTPGCASGVDDPECPPLFAQLGLAFRGQGTPPAQTVFVVK